MHSELYSLQYVLSFIILYYLFQGLELVSLPTHYNVDRIAKSYYWFQKKENPQMITKGKFTYG